MQKPNNYENVQGYAEFVPLSLGGHVCKIVKVIEGKSKAGKDMLTINLDIAEGEQKDYYMKQWESNTSNDKRWGCTVYQMVLDNDGNTNRGLKTIHTAIEKSNAGFTIVWGDGYAKALKGKLIGGVFGREQYINKDGEPKFSTKCMFFRSVETIKAGVEIPADKLLDGSSPQASSAAPTKKSEEPEDDMPF